MAVLVAPRCTFVVQSWCLQNVDWIITRGIVQNAGKFSLCPNRANVAYIPRHTIACANFAHRYVPKFSKCDIDCGVVRLRASDLQTGEHPLPQTDTRLLRGLKSAGIEPRATRNLLD
jgi:hypothetical protein